jgi:hypothetical protein
MGALGANFLPDLSGKFQQHQEKTDTRYILMAELENDFMS